MRDGGNPRVIDPRFSMRLSVVGPTVKPASSDSLHIPLQIVLGGVTSEVSCDHVHLRFAVLSLQAIACFEKTQSHQIENGL